MSDETPASCSLGAGAFERRLAEIAEIGADSLISRQTEGGRQLLLFRADAATRKRLDQIIAAEAECCSFLDLALIDGEAELVLSITAPQGARALADGLAAAFAIRQA